MKKETTTFKTTTSSKPPLLPDCDKALEPFLEKKLKVEKTLVSKITNILSGMIYFFFWYYISIVVSSWEAGFCNHKRHFNKNLDAEIAILYQINQR